METPAQAANGAADMTLRVDIEIVQAGFGYRRLHGGATTSICALRPICSGSMGAQNATPMASRLPSGGASAGDLAKTV